MIFISPEVAKSLIFGLNLHAYLYGPFSITFGKTGSRSCTFSGVGGVVPDIPHMASTWKVDMALLLRVKEVIPASMYLRPGALPLAPRGSRSPLRRQCGLSLIGPLTLKSYDRRLW